MSKYGNKSINYAYNYQKYKQNKLTRVPSSGVLFKV